MQRRPWQAFPLTGGNPFVNALLVVAGAVVLGAAMLLGVVVFVIFAASLVVAASVVAIRIWWLQRKMTRETGEPGPRADVIEGEYRIVDIETERRKRR